MYYDYYISIIIEIDIFLCIMINKYQWSLKFIKLVSGGLNNYFIIIYIVLCIMITKDQWFLIIILLISSG